LGRPVDLRQAAARGVAAAADGPDGVDGAVGRTVALELEVGREARADLRQERWGGLARGHDAVVAADAVAQGRLRVGGVARPAEEGRDVAVGAAEVVEARPEARAREGERRALDVGDEGAADGDVLA